MKTILRLVILCCCIFSVQSVLAQAQLQPWGNLTGISIRGTLMEWETR